MAIGLWTVASGAVIAVSPWSAWLRRPGVQGEPWSGFQVVAERARLGVAGSAVLLAIDVDGWYHAFFGPLVPVLVGSQLAVGGVALMIGGRRRWLVRCGGFVALWSLAAAGLGAGAGSVSAGDVSGLGLRLWAGGSAGCSVALVIVLGRGGTRPAPPERRWVAWLAAPAVLLTGAAAMLLQRAADLHPFADVTVLSAASLTAAVPAAGAVAAVATLAQEPASPIVVGANAVALVLLAVLFGLWLQAAMA